MRSKSIGFWKAIKSIARRIALFPYLIGKGIALLVRRILFWPWRKYRYYRAHTKPEKMQADAAFITLLVTGSLTLVLATINASQYIQQSNEERIEHRAYLDLKQESGIYREGEAYFYPMSIVNSGNTPAEAIVVHNYLQDKDGQKVVIATREEIHIQAVVYLTPGSVQRITFPFNDWEVYGKKVTIFDLLARDKGYKLVFEIKYRDYKNREHTLIAEYTIQPMQADKLSLIRKEEI